MEKSKEDKEKKEIIEWAEAIVIAIVLAIVIRTFLFEFIHVDGPSMQPTLYTGEQLLVDKLEYKLGAPKRGDVVICKFPGRSDNYVKRVIGLPGETLEIRSGKLYVDGKAINETYIKEPILSDFSAKVPSDSIMVMGDNRNNSMDSRDPSVGPIKKSLVIGKALFVVWPFDKAASLAHSYK